MPVTPKKIGHFLLSTIIAVLGLLHLHLLLVRYIDPDEFAHLHWTFNFFIGQIPYKDFFIYHTPFYQFLMLPLFFLPHTYILVHAARLSVYLFLILCMILVYVLTKQMSRHQYAPFLASLIVLVAPIMIDKGIEIRPDIPMVFFFLCALILLLKKTKTLLFSFLAGVCCAISLGMFLKMMFAVPALLFLFVFNLKGIHRGITQKELFNRCKPLLLFTIGGLSIAAIFLFYLLIHGALMSGLDAILRTTRDIYAISIMKFSPFLALSPWPLVYVTNDGPSLPWSLNIFLMLSMLGGTVLLFIDKQWKIASFYALFFLGSLLYLLLFPTPFVQYFIPIMIIGAPAAAFFLISILHIFIKRTYHLPVILIFSLIGLLSYGQQYISRVGKESSNAEQIQVLKDVAAHIKPDETIYDMTGSFVFRKAGYVLCCHRFANFIHTIKPSPPTLSSSLLKNQTKFIVLDRNGYVFWLVPEPEMTFIKTNYIESNYRKIYALGYRYLCNKSVCERINYEGGKLPLLNGSVLPIIIGETYKIHTTPSGQSISINGTTYQDQSTVYLNPGNYSLSIPPLIQEVQIRLDR